MGYTYEQLKEMGATPVPVVQPKTGDSQQKKKYTYDELVKMGATPSVSRETTEQPKKEGFGTTLLKGLVSAPLTQVARPFQAVAMAAGVPDETINKYNAGGMIAPVPTGQNVAGDIIKEVGRGVQTVALGVGAPIAGGAMFGAGASLERQGGNIANVQGAGELAGETALSAIGGKILSKYVGKVIEPVINTVGKAVPLGTQKLFKGAAEKVGNFAADKEIPVIGKVTKPLSEKIVSGAEKFDAGVNKFVSKSTGAVSDSFKKQYPWATKDEFAKSYIDSETSKLLEPGLQKTKGAEKAKSVVREAMDRGFKEEDLQRILKEETIFKSDNSDINNFLTQDSSDRLFNETVKHGEEVMVPFLEKEQRAMGNFTNQEVANEVKSVIASESPKTLTNTQKTKLSKQAENFYNNPSEIRPTGYTPKDLYYEKLQRESGLYKTPKGGGATSIPDRETALYKQLEAKALKNLIIKKANPSEREMIEKYFREQELRFTVVNYLQALNNQKIPRTLFQTTRRRILSMGGGMVGGGVGSGGGVAGSMFGFGGGWSAGSAVDDMFLRAENPIRVKILREIGVTEPEIYKIMREYAPNYRITAPKDKSGIDPNRVFANDIIQNTAGLMGTKALPAPKGNVIPLPGRTEVSIPPYGAEADMTIQQLGTLEKMYRGQGGEYPRKAPPKKSLPKGTRLFPENNYL